jgi:hypothetical protein
MVMSMRMLLQYLRSGVQLALVSSSCSRRAISFLYVRADLTLVPITEGHRGLRMAQPVTIFTRSIKILILLKVNYLEFFVI